MVFQKPFLLTAKSISREKPEKPQIKVINPLKKDVYVNAINLVADIYFSLKGSCEIRINNNAEFTPDVNAFKLRKELLLPLENQVLRRGESVEIYVWNSIDGDIVELSAQIIISENTGNITLSGQAIDDNTMLKGISGGAGDISDTHDIFPYKIYRNETQKFLINTKGRENMLLTMATSDILLPIIIPNSFIDSVPDIEKTVPANLLLKLINTLIQNTTGANSWYRRTWVIRCDNVPQVNPEYITQFVLIDYHNSDLKKIAFKLTSGTLPVNEYSYRYKSQYFTTGRVTKSVAYATLYFNIVNTITHTVEASDDINFVNDVIELGKYTYDGTATEQQYDTTKRYVRIRESVVCSFPSTNNLNVDPKNYPTSNATNSFTPLTQTITSENQRDILTHGGTAKLHFELLGVNNQWFRILDASALGSITQGDSKLIKYSIKGIPPSQTRFRAVLEVTNSLKTGVTIDLVA